MNLGQINFASLAVAAVILVAFALVVRSMYKKHKNGGGCGCGCSGCPSKGMCHGENK